MVHDCLSLASGCDPDEIAELTINQQTGMVVVRQRREYGWWGYISMFVTPGVLLANFVEYGKSKRQLRALKKTLRQLSATS